MTSSFHKAYAFFLVSSFFMLPIRPVFSQETSDIQVSSKSKDFSENLLGDIAGLRPSLLSTGVDLQAVYTADFFHNLSGGIKQGSAFMDNLDITADIDGSKLFGIEGSKAFIYVLNNNGTEFNGRYVGSNDGIDNIEVGVTAFKLYEAWLEQNLWNDKFSIRAGLYDLNSEFDVTDSSGIFLNPTYGIDTAYAATGQSGPSIFPLTSIAARVNVAPMENFYIRAAILDGVPGDPDNAKGTHVNFDDGDGVLVALETGYGDLTMGRVGAGGWWYSKEFEHLTDVDTAGDPLREHSDGFYGFVEKTLYSPSEDGMRHLDAFARFAMADDAVNQLDYSGSFGLAYTGFIASRTDDVAGLAFHGVHNGDPFVESSVTAGEPVDAGEWGIEATYSLQATPYLRIQPDLQYVNNPGASPDVEDSVSAGIRVEFNL